MEIYFKTSADLSTSIKMEHTYMTPARDPKQQQNMESWKRNHGRGITKMRHAEESWRRSYGRGALAEEHLGGMGEESWRMHLGGVMEENNTCTYMYVWR
jgi:hypothetical protein